MDSQFACPDSGPRTVVNGAGEIIFCPKCGRQNPENNFRCAGCGCVLHGPLPPRPRPPEYPALGGLLPYRNARALWAYYLGVFALIPCLGIPLGFAALMLGILGLKYARRYPEDRGKVHAWAGIILGVICGVGYTVLLLTIFLIPRYS